MVKAASETSDTEPMKVGLGYVARPDNGACPSAEQTMCSNVHGTAATAPQRIMLRPRAWRGRFTTRRPVVGAFEAGWLTCVGWECDAPLQSRKARDTS